MSDTELAAWPEDPLVYAKIIEILPEIGRTGGIEMKEHVRKLWDAAARWGYRDGYTDGYFDGTQNKKQRSNVQQPFHFEAPIGEPRTSRPMDPMFAEPIAFEERTSAPWAVPNSSSPHSRGSRTTSPLSASAPGIPHSNPFSAATLLSLRMSRGSSPYPKRSTSPSSSDVSGSGKRFSCEACGKDFSRAHDKKRHYETQHDETTVAHRCMYCEKNFSRADSLRRHILTCDGSVTGRAE